MFLSANLSDIDRRRPVAVIRQIEKLTFRRRAKCKLRHSNHRIRWSFTPPYNCAVRGGSSSSVIIMFQVTELYT